MSNILALTITIGLIFSVTSVSGRIKCPPVTLANGRSQLKNRGRIIKYTCFRGYSMLGEPYGACIRGKWDPDPPACLKPGCTQIRNFKNGFIAASMRSALMEFSCKPGYKLIGPSFIYCNGRRWSSMQPYCKAADISCNFEGDNTCSWLVDTHEDDDFMWNVHQNEAPSRLLGTGPKHDHSFAPNDTGHYLMIETSDYGPHTPLPARIHSPKFPVPSDNDTCFIFWYHMFGSTVGVLNIFMNNKLVFQKNGNHGDRWIKGVVPFPQNTTDLQLIFEGTHGKGYTGNIGLDDFTIGNSSDCTFTEVNSCEERCDEKAPDTASCLCTSGCFVDSSCCEDYKDFCGAGSSTISSEESLDYYTDITDTMNQEESELSTFSNKMDDTEAFTMSSETSSHSLPSDHKLFSTSSTLKTNVTEESFKPTTMNILTTLGKQSVNTLSTISGKLPENTANKLITISLKHSENTVNKLSSMSGKQSVNKLSTISGKQLDNTVNKLSTIPGKLLDNTVNKLSTLPGKLLDNTVNKLSTISGKQSVDKFIQSTNSGELHVKKMFTMPEKQATNTINKLGTISGNQLTTNVYNWTNISGEQPVNGMNKSSSSHGELTNTTTVLFAYSTPSGEQSVHSTKNLKSTLKQTENSTSKYNSSSRQHLTNINKLSTALGEHIIIHKIKTLTTKVLNEVNNFSTSTEVTQKMGITMSSLPEFSKLNPQDIFTTINPSTLTTFFNNKSTNTTVDNKTNKTKFIAISKVNTIKMTPMPVTIKSTLPHSVSKLFLSQKPSITPTVSSTIPNTYRTTTANPVNSHKTTVFKFNKSKIIYPKKYSSNSTLKKKEKFESLDVYFKNSFKSSTTKIPLVNFKKKIWPTAILFPFTIKPKLFNTTVIIASGQNYSILPNVHVNYEHLGEALDHNEKNKNSSTEIVQSISYTRKSEASLDFDPTAASDKMTNLSSESFSKVQGNFHVLDSNSSRNSNLQDYILPGILIFLVLASVVILACVLTKRRSGLRFRNGSEGDVLYISSEEMFDFNLARPS